MNRLWFPISLVCVVVISSWLGAAPAAPKETAPPAANNSAEGEFPDAWYFSQRTAGLKGLEGKTAPALDLKSWIGKEQTLAELKGKVVVVDFWATWCPPCMASLPHNVEMVNKFGKKGLTFLGVHESNKGSDKMAKVAKDKKINYPLAVDNSNKSTKAYSVSFFPTYVVIDRNGKVRAAGLQPGYVENVVTKLLDEKAQ